MNIFQPRHQDMAVIVAVDEVGGMRLNVRVLSLKDGR